MPVRGTVRLSRSRIRVVCQRRRAPGRHANVGALPGGPLIGNAVEKKEECWTCALHHSQAIQSGRVSCVVLC
ncbi:hypothetical protein EVAR_16830_1 [Eumeta japonica]|uniref:Uncharacterized protein n=1 Tax=Eumeta variegata TaxID=151549 RepID=A0A4C1V1J2_EUMVA|nr:hypothetical protein EVAR_16830_1 [Eumeta japonica]